MIVGEAELWKVIEEKKEKAVCDGQNFGFFFFFFGLYLRKIIFTPNFSSNLNLVFRFLIEKIRSLSFVQILNWSLYYFTIKVNDFLFVTCISFDTLWSISVPNRMSTSQR
jgi:hypothetical protein